MSGTPSVPWLLSVLGPSPGPYLYNNVRNIGEISEECGGSLHIHGVDGNDYVFTSTDASIPHPGIMTTAVSMEGCGC